MELLSKILDLYLVTMNSCFMTKMKITDLRKGNGLT